MCGRYGFAIGNINNFYKRFDISNSLLGLSSNYNISPGTYNPVVIRNSPNKLIPMYWGLIPHFSKDTNLSFRTINARIEAIDQTPSYRMPFLQRRCLVPAGFYFEWKKVFKSRIPYLFKLKHEEYFAFAGIYDTWEDKKNNKIIYSYSIITCSANSVTEPIHSRMPVILKKGNELDWIDPEIKDSAILFKILKSRGVELMETYRVSAKVGNPKNNDESVIEKVTGENQLTLLPN